MKISMDRSLVLLAVTGAMVCLACSVSPEDPQAPETQASAYDEPWNPVIKAGSLVAYDVNTAGEMRRVPTEELPLTSRSTQNWDWGDEAPYYPSSGTGIEVEDILSPGYVMMGIGARADAGAVTRLRLRQIAIRNDWTWDPAGAAWAAWARHPSDDGQNTAELELAISKPYVAVGLGMGLTNQNIKTIRIAKREYSPSQHKLIGGEYEDQIGPGAGELYWNTSYITHPAGMKEKMVIVGVGLRENNDNIETLRVWAAYLD